MAKEKAKLEDTVKDIIRTGIDSRPRIITAHAPDKTIIKPSNEDAEWLVNTADGSILVSLTAGISNSFTHHLGRLPEGFKVRYINTDARIYADDATWAKRTKTTIYLQTSADCKAKITVF